MKQLLTLPAGTAEREVSLPEAAAVWANYLGWSGPLFLVKNADRGRRLLIEAFGIEPGEAVGVPANTRRPLSEGVKRSRGRPLFVELDADLNFVPETPGLAECRLVWAQPVGGMAPPDPLPGKTLLVDYAFTLPAPMPEALTGAATLWGLHLDDDPSQAGALIACTDPALAERLAPLVAAEEGPNPGRALAQCERLAGPDGLAARLLAIAHEVRIGMEIGAGLPMAPERGRAALPFGLAVRVPVEADLATFISYVRNEQVALDWLPELQPMFYAAYQVSRDPALTRRTAAHLARWVISPLGPDFVDDEVIHAVLGLLKAAEYTGVRWYTDPSRARWYGDLMVEWYGATHDAYRPVFAIDGVAGDGAGSAT